MGFVRFTEEGRGYAPRASLSPTGLIGLNRGALMKFHLDKYQNCVLYYDENTKRIGIELTQDENAKGIKSLRIRQPKGGEAAGADISAKSFLDFFGIGVTSTTIYPVAQDPETGLLVVDLNTGKTRRKRERMTKSSGEEK